MPACAICSRPDAELRLGPLEAHACLGCVRQLGHALRSRPESLAAAFPDLRQADDGSPEPRVRLADGRSVELRERTAQLKAELPLHKRVELVGLLGEIGLHREQVLEAAFVLTSDADRAQVQQVLALLFAPGRATPDAAALLRKQLLPS
jgi:hypothetical protein